MWKADLCQIQDLDTGYPSADVCAISCSWKYIIHKYISCPIKYTQFPGHRHSQQGSPPKPLSASELPSRSLHSGGRKTKALGRCESFHLQLDVKAGQTSCTLRCLLVSGVCTGSSEPVCCVQTSCMDGGDGGFKSLPLAVQMSGFGAECIKKPPATFFSGYVCVFCTFHLMLFLFPPHCVGVLPTASGTSQSWQTNIILSKAAEEGQATTAQDWWLSVRACGKPEVFTQMEQLGEPPAGKDKPPLPPCSHYTSQENLPAGGWSCPSHSP